MAGHLEQNLNLSISQNWDICELEISSEKSEFYYDDHIALTVNQRLLWGSSEIFELLSASQDEFGLLRFEWEQLFGKKGGDGISCLAGSIACSGPGTQKKVTLQ